MTYPANIQHLRKQLKNNTVWKTRHLLELTEITSLDEVISRLTAIQKASPDAKIEWVSTDNCDGEDCYCDVHYEPYLHFTETMTDEERKGVEDRLKQEIKWYEQTKAREAKQKEEAAKRQRKQDERTLKRLVKQNPELIKEILDDN